MFHMNLNLQCESDACQSLFAARNRSDRIALPEAALPRRAKHPFKLRQEPPYFLSGMGGGATGFGRYNGHSSRSSFGRKSDGTRPKMIVSRRSISRACAVPCTSLRLARNCVSVSRGPRKRKASHASASVPITGGLPSSLQSAGPSLVTLQPRSPVFRK